MVDKYEAIRRLRIQIRFTKLFYVFFSLYIPNLKAVL